MSDSSEPRATDTPDSAVDTPHQALRDERGGRFGRRVWPMALVVGLTGGSLLGFLTWQEYRAGRSLQIEQASVIRVVPGPKGLHCRLAQAGVQTWFYVAAPAAGLPQFFSFDSCSSSWQVGEVVPVMRAPAGHVMFGPRTTLRDVPFVAATAGAGFFLTFLALGKARRLVIRRWRHLQARFAQRPAGSRE